MSSGTLEELFGPVPAEHEHLERFGYREEDLEGGRYYVGRSDKGFAITLKRHRAKGFMSVGRRKKKKTVLPPQERAMKFIVNPEAIARLGEETNRAMGQMTESLSTVDFSKLNLGPGQVIPTPQEKPGMFRRVALWVVDKFYDEEWHRGARNTAWTALTWSFTVFALMTFGKGMLWLVML